jgi:EmrB/QacA subfamily drug resistance transporter
MPLSPLRLRLLVGALVGVSFLGALDHTVVSTSLATVAGELGALEHMSWIIVGYTVSSTIMLPIVGRLGDRFGPRAVFRSSLVLFVVASLACGFASDLTFLVIARVVQGASSAGLQLISSTIVAHVTSPRERPRYLALIGAAFPVAILIGPVLGGLITDFWGWPWVFWINVPVGVAAYALIHVAVPHIQAGERRSLDPLGAAVFAIFMTSLVLVLTWFTDPGVAAGTLVAGLVAVASFVALVLVERRAEHPILPLQLLADRTIATATALSAVIGLGLFAITSYMPSYFQMAYRTTATVSGVVPIATVLGMLVSNLATGWLSSRTGRYRVYPIVGTALGAVGLLIMSFIPIDVPLWVPAIPMFVVGIGTGAFMSIVIAVVQSVASLSEVGSVTGTVFLVRQVASTVGTAVIGGVVGVAVAASLPAGLDVSTLTPELVRSLDPATQVAVAGIYGDVFAPIFLALAVVYAVGFVAALLLPAGRLSDVRPEHQVADTAKETA